MNACYRLILTGLLAGRAAAWAAAPAPAENRESASVTLIAADKKPAEWSAMGPLFFKKTGVAPEGGMVRGFRPFWIEAHADAGGAWSGHFLYPIFSYSEDARSYRWSLFELIRHSGPRAGDVATGRSERPDRRWDVFPFWFFRESTDSGRNYGGIFPLAGTIRQTLGFERLSWVGFPLLVESERRGAITTAAPWPFLRVTRGAARGWGIWPLYTWFERPGESRAETYLWPLGYNHTVEAGSTAVAGTPARREIGALPFYARSSGPGYVSEDYAWPFFGYTERTSPAVYSERRYLWPLFVQGHGEGRRVNRWAPFYTQSVVRGSRQEWYAWPFLRYAQWNEADLERRRTQLLYFLYWNEEQRLADRADSAVARLTHVWPLFSAWGDGAGRRQWQLFSPLEVFFPGNENVRLAWSPLLALARHDQSAPGNSRTSLLWDLVTWEKRPTAAESNRPLGHLVSVVQADGAKRVAIGRGLFGFQRTAHAGWRAFWFDFSRYGADVSAQPAS